jgi:hypothetical protein
MWSTIAKYAVKVAVWAAGHPDEVVNIVSGMKTATAEIKK